MPNGEVAIVSSFSPLRETTNGLGISVIKRNPGQDTWKVLQRLDRQDASWLTLNPSHQYLYACYSLRDSAGKVYGRLEAYHIDPVTHLLTLLNQLTVPDGPAHMTVSPDGKSLLIANYFAGDFVVRALHPDGRIGQITSRLQDHGTGPNARQEAAHPHAIVFDQSSDLIGVTDLGNDTISLLKLTNGQLSRVATLTVPAGTGPRHLVFSPTHPLLYVIGELSGRLLTIAYDRAAGKLGSIVQDLLAAPADYQGPQSGAEIRLHPNQKVLYTSNRGPHALMTYHIAPTTGKLTLLATTTAAMTNPTGFTLNPQGTALYVPNNSGQGIVTFDLDPVSGTVADQRQPISLTAPNVMVFI